MPTRLRTVLALVAGLVVGAVVDPGLILIPAPAWFIALDLVGAYLPMACLATWLGGRAQQGGGSARMVAA